MRRFRLSMSDNFHWSPNNAFCLCSLCGLLVQLLR